MDQEPPERAADETLSRGTGVGRLLFATVALVLLYVLSCGPTYRFLVHDSASEFTWYKIYSPLAVTAEACQPIEHCLNWYMRLWNEDGPKSSSAAALQ